jgi:GNAT superfamily N-acetyltransferase
MSLQLQIARDVDFPELIAAEWEAFENPLIRIFRLYCPVIDNDRAKSLAAKTELDLRNYKTQKPGVEAVWLKVVDTAKDNKIVGGAQWVFYKNRPDQASDQAAQDTLQMSVPDRHPEGGSRIFATLAVEQLSVAEAKKGSRPYAYIGAFFTIPDYRTQGIGGMLMTWGLEKADELGFESWIEAAPSAVSFYERHGYVKVQDIELDPLLPEDLSEKELQEWRSTSQSILSVTAIVMWRPAGGKYVEGQTVKPWETQ